MAHKTLIGGTAYSVSGGKTLVNGTAYSVKNGKTLVDNTEYEIKFGESNGGIARVTIAGNFNYCSVSVNGINYSGNSVAELIEVPVGTSIICTSKSGDCDCGEESGRSYVIVNGTTMVSSYGSTVNHTYTVVGDTIIIGSSSTVECKEEDKGDCDGGAYSSSVSITEYESNEDFATVAINISGVTSPTQGFVEVFADFPKDASSASGGVTSNPALIYTSGSWAHPVPVGTPISCYGGYTYVNGTLKSSYSEYFYVVTKNITISMTATASYNRATINITET